MANIDVLFPFILKWEGGFSNDPIDKGGATNKGVTIGTWRSCGYDKDGDGDIDVEDLKLMSDEDVKNEILKPFYWDRWQADHIKVQEIANILVDWVWASGANGIKVPQNLLGLKPDGIVGPLTLKAINTPYSKLLMNRLINARKLFINRIVKFSIAEYETKIGRKATVAELYEHTQKRFERGWRNRLDALISL